MENLSVLVLDHDPESLLNISNTLAKFNFKVLRFQTAADALDSLERGIVKGEELDLVVAEIYPAKTDMETLVVFHHILDALEVPFVTMCAYVDLKAVSEHMTLGSCFNVLKPFGTETGNILLHKALQRKSRRVLPEESTILKKTQDRMDSSSTKNHGSETEEDEEPDVVKAHGCSQKLRRFIWSTQLHEKFLRAVEVLGESATPRKIRRHMNVKNLNLTLDHISSHLQKHKLREQRLKQVEEDYQKHASMRKLSGLITSAQNAATPEPINHPTTTPMQITHGVAPATWDFASATSWVEYPGNLRAQVEETSVEAEVFSTSARASAVSNKRPAQSVWDKYEESLQRPRKRQPGKYVRKVLPVKSNAIDKYGGIAHISATASDETGYGVPAPARVNLQSSGSDSRMTSPLQQLKDTSRAEAAGNYVDIESMIMDRVRAALSLQKDTMNQMHATYNPQKDTMNQVHTAAAPYGNTMNGVHAAVNLQKDTMNQIQTAVSPHGNTMNQVHAAVNLQKDTMNQVNQVDTAFAPHEDPMNGVHTAAMVADGLVDLGSKALLDCTGSYHSTAGLSDPFSSWEEVEGFWMSLVGEEEQGNEPDDLLQVDDAWNQALQPANVDDAPVAAQTGDAPAAAQEPGAGGALAYDPEFSVDDVPVWIPHFAGDDYGIPF